MMATGHYECVGHAEIDPKKAKLLKQEIRLNKPNLPNGGGVLGNTVYCFVSPYSTKETVDLICKALPSVCGIMKEKNDNRGYIIKKAKPYIRPTYENYHLVMARPELQFKRSRWFDIKGRLDRKHWVGKYTFNYNEKKLRDYCEKYAASDLFWKKPCRPEQRKDYVEQLIGDTVFQILPREVCYYYFDHAIDLLNDTWNGIPNAYDDEYSQFVGIGWLMPDKVAEEYREEKEQAI